MAVLPRRSGLCVRSGTGSAVPGKMADLALWNPVFFGVKPGLIIKGGMIAGSLMGNPNAQGNRVLEP